MMTDILWLLYAADVAGNVRDAAIMMLVLGVIAAGIYTIVYSVTEEEWPPHLKKICGGLALVAAVAMLTPSKQLILIAAGARAGAVAIETPIGQKAVRLLDAALTKALAAVEGEKK